MFCPQETQHDFWLEQQTRVNMTVFAPTLDAAFAAAGIPLRPGATAAPAWVDPNAPKVCLCHTLTPTTVLASHCCRLLRRCMPSHANRAAATCRRART